MRFLCTLFVALAPVAWSQTVDGLKRQPRQFEFPSPFNSAAVQKALSGKPQVLVLPGTLPEDTKVCAVRLLEFKADSSVDPGIVHPVGPPTAAEADKNTLTDKTPFRLPMPACPAQR